MDPNRNRRRSSQPPQMPTMGHVASTGAIGPAGAQSQNNNSRPASRNVSPSPSRLSLQPSMSQVDGGETETEEFPALDQPSSMMSGPSQADSRPRSSAASLEGAAPNLPRQPSIRIRRRSSSARSGSSRPGSARSSAFLQALQTNTAQGGSTSNTVTYGDAAAGGRPRSISQPERARIPDDAPYLARHSRRVPQVAMPRLTEEGARPTMEELNMSDDALSPAQSLPDVRMSMTGNRPDPHPVQTGNPRLQRMRKVSKLFWPGGRGDRQQQSSDAAQGEAGPSMTRDQEYDARLVDYLDTIDPEVQTLSTLTNVQNSLFVPDLGKWINRRPTYTLSQHDVEQQPARPPPPPPSEGMGEIREDRKEEAAAEAGTLDQPPLQRSSTITSRLTESHYAALPHGASLEGWTEEEKMELDDHVRHMLHSRRSKMKRRLKGFGQYVRRPLGFLVTLYATLITLFGLAWVLFLIGWIYVGEKQLYVIHIIDSVLVALFAIMGDGLAPFRAVDTYHMGWVLHYARVIKNADKRSRSRLQKRNIPEDVRQSMDIMAATQGEESLRREREESADAQSANSGGSGNPHTMRNNIVDTEDVKSGIEAYEDTPLTFKQQKRLHHHQKKLAKSHSFYKPNETETHYAFPLGYLIAIVILLDCHSLLQISLGACTWGIDYHTRPMAITTVILCVSITCNITAGVVISIGDRKTRKQDVWQLMDRQALTGDAMRVIEQKRSNSNKADKTGESDLDTPIENTPRNSTPQDKEPRERNKLVKRDS